MARVDPLTGLNDRQRAFAENYAATFDPQQSYLDAGYKPKSRRVAATNASELLRNPKIQAYLQRLRQESFKRTTISISRVIEEIGYVALSNVTDVATFDNNGVILNRSDKLPRSVTSAIQFVQSTQHSRGNVHKIKMHDKVRALSLLADYYGLRSDFNVACAALKKYGLQLVKNASTETGWDLLPYAGDSPPDDDFEDNYSGGDDGEESDDLDSV